MLKIYRTVIQYEILSSEPYKDENLEEVASQTFDGEWSGMMLEPITLNEELVGEEAKKVIVNQGTNVEFFEEEDD